MARSRFYASLCTSSQPSQPQLNASGLAFSISPHPLAFFGLWKKKKTPIDYEAECRKYVTKVDNLTGIPIEVQNRLYGYWKQAQEGDYQQEKPPEGLPGFFAKLFGGQVKKNNQTLQWEKCKGMDRVSAMKNYIELAKEYVGKV